MRDKPWQTAPKHHPGARLFTYNRATECRAFAWCFGALCHGQMDQPCYSRWHLRCTVPSPGRRQIIAVTVNYVTSKCPVIRIPRKKTSDRKSLKSTRFDGGCDEIWDSTSIEGKDKLSTDPLTAILEFMELRTGTVGFRVASLPSFLTVSTTQMVNFDKTSSKWL